jgi:hypothetical protein
MDQCSLEPQEVWKPVVGYEHYEVSNLGRVRSQTYVNSYGRRVVGRVLSLSLSTSGHPKVTLYKDNTKRTEKVHQLVLNAFVGPCPPGQECRHEDDVPSNNCLSNLSWGTRSDNFHDRVRNDRHHEAVKTQDKLGHKLATPNLVESRLPVRQCKACHQARSYCSTHPDIDFIEEANRRYERLVG